MATLYEVIADQPSQRRPAYGVTFTDPAEADAYAAALRAAGYSVDHSEPFETFATARDALDDAAAFFKDAALTADRKAE